MDASVFCFAALELAGRIVGMRIEKVFTPLPFTWNIALGRAGYLIWHAGKPVPFFYLTQHKPENPCNPGGQTMWLRKRLRGRFILESVSDWPRRRLALRLSAGEGVWLVVDLQGPPSLVEALPSEFGMPPQWPDLDRILSQPDLWKTHPHLTPPLRRHLAGLNPADGESLLLSMRQQTGVSFHCGQDERGRAQVRLWSMGEDERRFAGALDAAEFTYAPTLARIASGAGAEQSAAARACRRLERIVTRLEEDHARLQSLVQGRGTALLLQNHLHALDKTARLATLLLPDQEGRIQEIRLDPERTVLENMVRLFSRAAKGERGLATVAARLETVRRELDAARSGQAVPDGVPCTAQAASFPLPARYRKLKVGVYRSSDGFYLLRGRNAQANHQLLTQVASPFDYWLHAQDGPGAHVIIRRDFPRQEVPETTLQEAAVLAALASHLKMGDRGDVLLCLVRDVRTIKGAALGVVGVDKVLRTVRPAIDPNLEKRLQVLTGG
ncbi:MAG: DUF814 domain-containing protein [Desulfovibrionales bacterium]|nr:DUF814 domain-containing protein [Desulfovibrionales bacterium]